MARRANGKIGPALLLAAVIALAGLGWWIYRDFGGQRVAIDPRVVDATGAGEQTGLSGDSTAATPSPDGRTGVAQRLGQIADGMWA